MNTWILAFLIITCLALGYIFLAYFGVFRKLMINCVREPENYIKSYRELEKVEGAYEKYKFVISLSTTPEDISKMKPVISSLLDQTIKVDEICINIPPDAVGIIPAYIEKCVRIYKINKDYGPSNNIIPTLLREKDANTVLMALENDVIYGKNFIEEATKWYTDPKYDGSYDKDVVLCTELIDNIACGSIITRVTNFDPKIVNIDKQNDDVYLYPEKWISEHVNGSIRKINYKENYIAFVSTKHS